MATAKRAAAVKALKVHHIEIYRDGAEEWRWRAKGQNGRVLADCGEGYKRIGACLAAMEGVTNATARGIPAPPF